MQKHVVNPVRIREYGYLKRSNMYVTAQTSGGYVCTVLRMEPWSVPSMKVNMLRTLKDFEICAIGASDGDLGHVKDLDFDDHAWVIHYLIANTSNFVARASGARCSAVGQQRELGGLDGCDRTRDLTRRTSGRA